MHSLPVFETNNTKGRIWPGWRGGGVRRRMSQQGGRK